MSRNGAARAVRGLGKVSVDELTRELQRRRSRASRLVRKRDRLLTRLSKLEQDIRDCGVSLNGSTGHRSGSPRRSTTLVQALAGLLKGRTMSVTDMSEAVQEAGYRTSSPNFRTIVNAAVIKETKVFKRVGRGQYTAR